MANRKRHRTKFRLWIYTGDSKFLGPGRVELLERIHRTGSIQKAAEGMEMSYRQAWQMVKEINERAQRPLVQKHLGGKGGGGAVVTEAGLRAIEEYNRLEQKVHRFMLAEFAKTGFFTAS